MPKVADFKVAGKVRQNESAHQESEKDAGKSIIMMHQCKILRRQLVEKFANVFVTVKNSATKKLLILRTKKKNFF